MHAQLVEAVSELLRERLGPTSEYVSSLIGIQAAYINTNHPEFVAGSAAIARGELPQGQNVPVIKKVSSNIPFSSTRGLCLQDTQQPQSEKSHDDDDVSDSEVEDVPLMNGGGPRGSVKSRTVSQSQHDNRNRPQTIAPTPKHFNDLKGDGSKHPRSASSNAAMTGATTAMLNMSHAHQSSTSPNTARETFLNYFFGGVGPAGQAGPSHGGIQQKGPAGGARDLLPDLGHRRSQNTGDRLEAGPAYDMKSLGKHLEAVSHRLINTALKSLIMMLIVRSFLVCA
jgi:dynamin 1-like protein